MFKPGNKAGAGNKGKTRLLTRTEAKNIDLKNFRTFMNDRADWGKVVNTLVHNAFEHENKNGTIGSVSWAKLFLSYALGQPPVKVETQHTNVVDMMRMMVEESIQDVQTVDSEAEEIDD